MGSKPAEIIDFFIFVSVLACTGSCLARSRSLVQGVLAAICKIHIFRKIQIGNRQEGLIDHRRRRATRLAYLNTCLTCCVCLCDVNLSLDHNNSVRCMIYNSYYHSIRRGSTEGRVLRTLPSYHRRFFYMFRTSLPSGRLFK